MELEKLQLQNQCLLLDVREKEEKLRLQQEKHPKQDAVRIQMKKKEEEIEEMLQLKASMERALTRIKVTKVMRSWGWSDVLDSLIIS